jgi:hypothetical protein
LKTENLSPGNPIYLFPVPVVPQGFRVGLITLELIYIAFGSGCNIDFRAFYCSAGKTIFADQVVIRV